jgi:hypothetical protein
VRPSRVVVVVPSSSFSAEDSHPIDLNPFDRSIARAVLPRRRRRRSRV